MINSTYLADRWQDIAQDKVSPAAVGITDTVSAGATKNIDYTLTDDIFFRGIELGLLVRTSEILSRFKSLTRQELSHHLVQFY